MNYFKYDIVFQEIPNEISLALYMTGCPLRCKGCHSPELWNPINGQELSEETLNALIDRYEGSTSCLLFMGGEWEPAKLIQFVLLGKSRGLKVALYTGCELEQLPRELVLQLDYLKTGPWIEHLGGLNSPTTNQRFYTFKEATCL